MEVESIFPPCCYDDEEDEEKEDYDDNNKHILIEKRNFVQRKMKEINFC